MIRVLIAAAMLFAASRSHAQSLGCVELPVGPPLDAAVVARSPHLPGARAVLALPGLPAAGHDCVAVMPPVHDILRGAPPPAGGLLRGDDGRGDLLREPPPAR